MTCPSGCLRVPDHKGLHTTSPEVAKRLDAEPQHPSLFPKPQFIPPFKTAPRRPTFDNSQRNK